MHGLRGVTFFLNFFLLGWNAHKNEDNISWQNNHDFPLATTHAYPDKKIK